MLNLLLSFVLLTSRPDTLEPIRITNLSSGDKDSRITYVGIMNQFRVEDSLVSDVEQSRFYSFSGNTLTIKPTSTGTVNVVFIRGQEKISVAFPSRVLGIISITPAAAVNDTLDVEQLEKDPSLILNSPDRDDYYEGYIISSFVANLNNRNFACGKSFSAELLEACKNTRQGDVLRITDYTVIHPGTGKCTQVKWNKPYFLKPPVKGDQAFRQP